MSGASPLQHHLLDTAEDETDARVIADKDEENAIILSPNNSERQYYRDPFTGLQREIWRPGDGDGEKAVDYFEAPGPPAPLEKRRRFYQSRTGTGPIKRGVNEPPKYVILDDRAAHEVFASDIHRKTLAENWGHDFGGIGKIRARRPHRGRGAIGDPDASGEHKFHFAYVGGKGERYYFTGETGYRPIIYRDADEIEEGGKRKATSPSSSSVLPNPPKKRRGHNQHTPKELLVKNGAPPFSTNPHRRRRTKLNQFLKRDPTPEAPFDKARAKMRRELPLSFRHSVEEDERIESIFDKDDGEGLWVEQDDPEQCATSYEPVDPNEESSSDTELFPFHRRRSTSGFASATPVSEPVEYGRQKEPQRRDLFPHQLTEGEAWGEGYVAEGQDATDEDERAFSGLNASQLEEELAKAKIVIEEQELEMNVLKKARGEEQERAKVLEAEVEMLRGVEKVDDDGNDGYDDETWNWI